MKVRSSAATDPGRVRRNNEDRFYASDEYRLYAVADGVGGHAAGEVASQIFVDTVRAHAQRFSDLAAATGEGPEEHCAGLLALVTEVFQQACGEIYERTQARGDEGGRRMATTGVVLGLLDGFAVLGHVGDSRTYLMRDGQARQLTTDHTLVRKLLDRGVLTEDQVATFRYRNVLERAVGDKPVCRLDTMWLDVLPSDRFLLCSDGLSGHLDPGRLLELGGEPAQAYVDAANAAGGSDNITLVAVEVEVEEGVSPAAALGTDARMKALAGLGLFRDLEFPEWLQVMKMVKECRFHAGEQVVREGEPGDRIFVVVEGTLAVEKDGVELVTLAPRDHFGEIAFLDARPRSASVAARTDAVLLSIERHDFETLARQQPAMANKLLRRFVLGLSERLRAVTDDFVKRER